MPSYYSVVRFVPSALAEEFVNVGVLTFGDGKVRGKFLENWWRVERFADVKTLASARAFQEWVEGSMVPEGPSDKRMRAIDESDVRRLSGEWAGSVQLSEPRASTLEPDDLLEDIAPTFLIEPPARNERPWDKRRVVTETSQAIRSAILEKIGKDTHLAVHTRRPISAGIRARVFDVVVSNAAPRLAVQCVNFNVNDMKRVLDQVDVVAFAMEDVHKKSKDFPFSVVVVPPEEEEATFAQAKQTLESVGAEVVFESGMDEWSARAAERLAKTAS